jgi:hypothetical protein
MYIWTYGHVDMWTYGLLDICMDPRTCLPDAQDMTIYTTVYGLYNYCICIHNNVLKNSYLENIYVGKNMGNLLVFLDVFHFRLCVTLDVLSVYIVSHYTFCPYTLCRIRSFVCIHFVTLYLMSL